MSLESPNKIEVFLLDDHEIVRRGVRALVNIEPDMVVTGEASTVLGALQVVDETRPQVAVLDVRLQEGNGLEACREIRSRHPEIACIMLTSFSDDQAIIDASIAGASGFVLKQVRSNEIVESIRKVAGGVVLLDRATVRLAMRRFRTTEAGRIASLTPQESRVFELIGEGLSNREIGEELHLAEKTVKNYVTGIFTKLGLTRRTEAAIVAARLDERAKRRYE